MYLSSIDFITHGNVLISGLQILFSLIIVLINGLKLIKCLIFLVSFFRINALTCIPVLQSSNINGRFSFIIKRLNAFKCKHFPYIISPILMFFDTCVLCINALELVFVEEQINQSLISLLTVKFSFLPYFLKSVST